MEGIKALERFARATGKTLLTTPGELPDDINPPEPDELVQLNAEIAEVYIDRAGELYIASTDAYIIKKAAEAVKSILEREPIVRPATQNVITYIKDAVGASEEDQHADGQSEEEKSAAQKRFDTLIIDAFELGVSDVHIEIRRQCVTVECRVDGVLIEHKSPKMSFGKALEMVSAKWNFDAHQGDGQATSTFGFQSPMGCSATVVNPVETARIKVRIGTFPTSEEEGDVVVRLLTTGGKKKIPSHKELGYLPEQEALLKKTTHMPFGCVLLTGPTGSGKSTSLAATVVGVPKGKKIYTLEDPIETPLPNASQGPIDPTRDGRNWVDVLRATLRVDPDVIVIGELRDKEVTPVAARAASTGHLVYSTLHVNSAVGVVEALNNYELENYQIAERSFLRVICAQRLTPKVCPYCSTSLSESKFHSNEIRIKTYFQENFPDSVERIRCKSEEGCTECRYTGNKGRVLIAEVVYVDSKSRGFILKGDTDGWYKYLKSQGWKDMTDHAAIRVAEGKLCPFSVEPELHAGFGIDATDDSFSYTQFEKDVIDDMAQDKVVAEIKRKEAPQRERELGLIEQAS